MTDQTQQGIALLRNADRHVVGLLTRFWGLLVRRRPRLPDPIGSILCIQLWGIGETILTLPVIKAISELFPKARLTVLATRRNQQVFAGQEFIDEVQLLSVGIGGPMCYALQHLRQFDLAVDFEEFSNTTTLLSLLTARSSVGFRQKSGPRLYNRSVEYDGRVHTTQAFHHLAMLLGATEQVGPLLPVHYPPTAQERVERWLADHPTSGIRIGVAPGTAESGKTRAWPLPRYAQLVQRLVETGCVQVVMIGAAWDRPAVQNIMSQLSATERKQVVDSAGHFSLEETFALINRLGLLVTNDSGALHMASCLGVPVVAVFGPTPPDRWGPLSRCSQSVYAAVDCSPCIHSHLGIIPLCRWRDGPRELECMKRIEVEEVFQAVHQVRRLLAKESGESSEM